MESIVITSSEEYYFEQNIKRYLEDGWIISSTSCDVKLYDNGKYLENRYLFGAILIRETN